MSWILDILLVAIAVGAIVIGARRGFFKSIVGLAGIVLAVVLMWSFATPLATVVDNSVIRPWAVARAAEAQGVTEETPTSQLDLAQIDSAVSGFLGIDILGVEEIPETAGEYLDAIFLKNGITLAVSKALAAVAIFIASLLALWLLSFLLKPILKLPVLRQCNGLLGAVIGVVNAIILLLILSTAVYLIGTTAQGEIFNSQTVEQTMLFKYIHQNNPILNWIIK